MIKQSYSKNIKYLEQILEDSLVAVRVGTIDDIKFYQEICTNSSQKYIKDLGYTISALIQNGCIYSDLFHSTKEISFTIYNNKNSLVLGFVTIAIKNKKKYNKTPEGDDAKKLILRNYVLNSYDLEYLHEDDFIALESAIIKYIVFLLKNEFPDLSIKDKIIDKFLTQTLEPPRKKIKHDLSIENQTEKLFFIKDINPSKVNSIFPNLNRFVRRKVDNSFFGYGVLANSENIMSFLDPALSNISTMTFDLAMSVVYGWNKNNQMLGLMDQNRKVIANLIIQIRQHSDGPFIRIKGYTSCYSNYSGNNDPQKNVLCLILLMLDCIKLYQKDMLKIELDFCSEIIMFKELFEMGFDPIYLNGMNEKEENFHNMVKLARADQEIDEKKTAELFKIFNNYGTAPVLVLDLKNENTFVILNRKEEKTIVEIEKLIPEKSEVKSESYKRKNSVFDSILFEVSKPNFPSLKKLCFEYFFKNNSNEVSKEKVPDELVQEFKNFSNQYFYGSPFVIFKAKPENYFVIESDSDEDEDEDEEYSENDTNEENLRANTSKQM